MKIGIDIDGVLTNIEQWQLDDASKYYYEKYKKQIINPKAYNTEKMFNMPGKDDEWWFETIEEYLQQAPRLYAAEIIKKLKQEQNEIYIITARNADESTTINQKTLEKETVAWLKKHNIIYDKLIFSSEDKSKTCNENKIDIMIEDKPENIIEVSKHIPVICYNASYNENCKGKNIIRCYSWYDIYVKIQKLDKSTNI